MKKRNKVILLINFTATQFSFGSTTQFKPITVNSVQGHMPNKYAVVYTNITKSPQDERPIISRSVKGYIYGPENKLSVNVNQELTTPKKEIEYKSRIPEALAKVAGAINPKAGAAVSAIAVIVNEGLRIAGEEMTKLYGNDPLSLNILEILPSKYYRINTSSGEVEVTNQFKPALKLYNKLMTKYANLSKEYNKQISIFNKKLQQLKIKDPYRQNTSQWENMQTEYNKIKNGILKDVLEVEIKLEKLALHRIAIMPKFTKPGTGCQTIGSSGPFGLLVYFYIGAKQTNIFDLDYCQKNLKESPKVVINLNSNTIDKKTGKLIPGGLSVQTALNDSNITFPFAGGTESTNWSSKYSNNISWFDELLESEEATSITPYLVPFNLNELRENYQKMKDQESEEAFKKDLDMLDTAINKLEQSKDSAISGNSEDSFNQSFENQYEPEENEELSEVEEGLENEEGLESKELVSHEEQVHKNIETYYDVLQIQPNASTSEIRKAYLKLSKQEHPDKSEKPNAKEIFQKIQEAYETLSDPEKKAVYDKSIELA